MVTNSVSVIQHVVAEEKRCHHMLDDGDAVHHHVMARLEATVHYQVVVIC